MSKQKLRTLFKPKDKDLATNNQFQQTEKENNILYLTETHRLLFNQDREKLITGSTSTLSKESRLMMGKKLTMKTRLEINRESICHNPLKQKEP